MKNLDIENLQVGTERFGIEDLVAQNRTMWVFFGR